MIKPHFKMLPVAWRLLFGNPKKVRHIVFMINACEDHGYHAQMCADFQDEKIMLDILQAHVNMFLLRNPPQE